MVCARAYGFGSGLVDAVPAIGSGAGANEGGAQDTGSIPAVQVHGTISAERHTRTPAGVGYCFMSLKKKRIKSLGIEALP